MKKIYIILFAALATVSCKKDDTLRYNNITMGNIEGESIVSDQGNTFDIAETLYKVDLSSFEQGRVILSCDVLKETSANRYDIRLTGIASVLTKPTVTFSTISPDSEETVCNPLIIRDIWYGGGYINMYIQFSVKNDSEEKHLINLIYDDTASIDEGAVQDYTFILRHNAFGEIPTEDNVKEYGWSAGYVSFPIAGLIKEDVAKITIKHNAHPFKNGRFDSLDSKEVSKTYDWKRVGFEQAGSAPTIPSPMHYKKFSVR